MSCIPSVVLNASEINKTELTTNATHGQLACIQDTWQRIFTIEAYRCYLAAARYILRTIGLCTGITDLNTRRLTAFIHNWKMFISFSRASRLESMQTDESIRILYTLIRSTFVTGVRGILSVATLSHICHWSEIDRPKRGCHIFQDALDFACDTRER